jgi:branched-chain amino acid transport system permease protein
LPHGLWGEIERRFDLQLLPVGYRLTLSDLLKNAR